MSIQETHPCPHHKDGKCVAYRNWWDEEPSDCDYAPEQLRLSGEDSCSAFPGEFINSDGTLIRPFHLETLGNIAKITKEE